MMTDSTVVDVDDVDRGIVVAETIARIAHYGQTCRFGGESFITHPAAVAADVARQRFSRFVATAWLHDVLEDTPLTVDHLRSAGVADSTIEAVEILTRVDPFQPYDDYIERIVSSHNAAALIVKRADLEHNLRPSCPPEHRERYLKALGRISTCAAWRKL